MKTVLCLLTLVAMSCLSVFAQNPKFELFGDYSYMQFNPTVNGLQSRALNGGGGGIQFNMGRYFGIKGEFQGYGSTQWTTTVTAPIGTPNGIIPVGTYKSNGNMFTYLFGPVVKFPAKHIVPFGELLFGGSNTNGYASLTDAIVAGGGTINRGSTQHPFTMAIGGGLDVAATKHVSFRLAEVDYVLTRYTNPLTQTNNQNNFRYVGGIIFTFGGE